MGCAGDLICPVCGARLAEVDRSFRCARGHGFDRAREGYVHLLPAGHGRSKLRGDPAEMVRARRRFLERGHYGPVAAALAGVVGRLRAARRRGRTGSAASSNGCVDDGQRGLTVLDVGCGDGYYIGRLRWAAGEPDDADIPSTGDAMACGARAGSSASAAEPSGAAGDDCFYGLDLSKDALRLAARAHPGILFFVNDVRHRICLADASVDLLLNVFAPRNPDEFARVLRPDGLAVAVVPNAEHLRELRERLPLIGIQPEKRDRTVERLGAALESVGDERVEYRTELEPDDVVDLVRMTPNYWHADEATLAAAAALGRVAVTVSVRLLRFRRRRPDS